MLNQSADDDSRISVMNEITSCTDSTYPIFSSGDFLCERGSALVAVIGIGVDQVVLYFWFCTVLKFAER